MRHAGNDASTRISTHFLLNSPPTVCAWTPPSTSLNSLSHPIFPDAYTRPFETTACAAKEPTTIRMNALEAGVCVMVRTKNRQGRHGIRRKHKRRSSLASSRWGDLCRHVYRWAGEFRQSLGVTESASPYLYISISKHLGSIIRRIKIIYPRDDGNRIDKPTNNLMSKEGDIKSQVGHKPTSGSQP